MAYGGSALVLVESVAFRAAWLGKAGKPNHTLLVVVTPLIRLGFANNV